MTMLEVKTRHVGHAARALPFGFSRDRSLKSGMKEYYQCIFGVRELVSKIFSLMLSFTYFSLSMVDWS